MKYINIEDGYTKKDIKEVAESINRGEVVILPTDTVYGIVANALNEKAVSKIYEIKKRDKKKPMNILVSNIEMIRKNVKNITEAEERIIKEFFPGALTIIFEKNSLIPDIVTGGLDTIGIRMPENKFLLELIDTLRNANCCNKF